MLQSESTHIQIVQHLQPGGIESMVLDFCEFSERNQRVHIVSLEGDKNDALLRWPRLQQYASSLTFLNKQPGVQLKTVWQLTALLKRERASLVHTHHIGPMLYGGLASRFAGVKRHVHTEHDAWHLDNKRHRDIASFCLTAFHPLLIADAAIVASQIQTRLPRVHADIIYNGIDLTRFHPGNQQRARQRLGLPHDKHLLGCAARLHPVKGHHRLISVLKHYPHSVHLALAGTGEMEPVLREMAEQEGVAERVHFLGLVDDMPSFYQAIDIFCLLSDNEGLPLSPLEAQACNTPVVLTDVGGARETACPISGQVVPLDDQSALRLAINKTLLALCKHTPRTFVEQQYDVRKMVREYNALATLHWSA